MPHVFIQFWNGQTLLPIYQVDTGVFASRQTLAVLPSRPVAAIFDDTSLDLAVFDERTPIVAWVEPDETKSEPGLHVVYLSEDGWVFLPNPEGSESNFIQLIAGEGVLYVAYEGTLGVAEIQQFRLNSQAWESIGYPVSLTEHTPISARFVSTNRGIALMWTQSDGRLNVALWNGEVWSLLDPPSTSHLIDLRIFDIVADSNNTLYATWIEDGNLQVALHGL